MVAVKVFKQAQLDLSRTLAEAKFLQALRHPNICSFFGTCTIDLGALGEVAASEVAGAPVSGLALASFVRSQQHRHGLVLEFLEGGSLAKLLGFEPADANTSRLAPSQLTQYRAFFDSKPFKPGFEGGSEMEGDGASVPPSPKGRHGGRWASLPSVLLLRLAKDVASGLEYLHSQGVVHRDVKVGKCVLRGRAICMRQCVSHTRERVLKQCSQPRVCAASCSTMVLALSYATLG